MTKLALLQLDPTVGDLSGNTKRLEGLALLASNHGATVGISTELAVCGYPPPRPLAGTRFCDVFLRGSVERPELASAVGGDAGTRRR